MKKKSAKKSRNLNAKKSGAQNSKTSGAQVSKTSGAQASKASGTENSKASAAQISKTSGTDNSKASVAQASKTSGVQNNKTPEAPNSKKSAVQSETTGGSQGDSGSWRLWVFIGIGALIVIIIIIVIVVTLPGTEDTEQQDPGPGLGPGVGSGPGPPITPAPSPTIIWDTCGIRNKIPQFSEEGVEALDSSVESDKEAQIANAHCCKGKVYQNGTFKPGFYVKVGVGLVFFGDEDGIYKNIDRCFMAGEERRKDLALLRIDARSDPIPEPQERPFRYNSICILNPWGSLRYEDDLRVEIAGWGQKEEGSEQPKKLLQKGLLTYKNSSDCGEKDKRGNNFYCFYIDQPNIPHHCRGDSGGPLMYSDANAIGEIAVFLIGTVSHSTYPTPDKACGTIPTWKYFLDFHPHLPWAFWMMNEHWPYPIPGRDGRPPAPYPGDEQSISIDPNILPPHLKRHFETTSPPKI